MTAVEAKTDRPVPPGHLFRLTITTPQAMIQQPRLEVDGAAHADLLALFIAGQNQFAVNIPIPCEVACRTSAGRFSTITPETPVIFVGRNRGKEPRHFAVKFV